MKLVWSRAHKFFAVGVGVFFLLWIMSGIIMILPPLGIVSNATAFHQEALSRLRDQAISPSEAIKILDATAGTTVELQSLTLIPLLNRPTYLIKTRGGNAYLIDIQTGSNVIITKELAIDLAQQRLPPDVQLIESTLITSHTGKYPSGPLPIYLLEYQGPANLVAYVSTLDGRVRFTDRWNRMRETIEGLHSFYPLQQITGSDTLRKLALIGVSIVGAFAALTGYGLAIRRARSLRS